MRGVTIEKTIGQRFVKCTKPESYTNKGVRYQPRSEPRAYKQAKEDGTPNIQAGCGVNVGCCKFGSCKNWVVGNVGVAEKRCCEKGDLYICYSSHLNPPIEQLTVPIY